MNKSANPHDASARHYMEYAYSEMERGLCPASFAGKTVAHVFDQCSADLRRDVREMVKAVDAYLATFDADSTVERMGDHYAAVSRDSIAFWNRVERPAYLASRHARIDH